MVMGIIPNYFISSAWYGGGWAAPSAVVVLCLLLRCGHM